MSENSKESDIAEEAEKMPDLLEHMYCAQQINIPPNLPFILKQYAKAAIRTQPYDLLFWSAAYFRAKANNLPPPVKERLEYPPFDSPSRLSPGFLRVLHKQLGEHEYVRVEILYEKWLGVCLVKEALDSMLKIGNIHHRVPWLKFVAIAAGHICMSLGKTMVLVCEVLTDQPDGGAAWIPVEKFVELYQFLARLNCGADPPHSKHVELDLQSSSDSSTQVSTIVTEGKEEAEEKETGEKDSTAGLMVWPDIKPQPKSDHVRTPKADDEPGASSVLGVEVLDNAKGPVTELVTLYPATTKSEVSGHYESTHKIGTKPPNAESVGETNLSHSSLKENEDWIKIETNNLDVEGNESDQPLDLDKLIATAASRTEVAGKTKSRAGGKPEKEEAEESVQDQDNQMQSSEHDDKTSKQDVTQNAENISVKTSEKSTYNTSETEKSNEAESKDNVVNGEASLVSQEKIEGDIVLKNTTLDSTDSEFELDHSITMTNFVRTRDIGYSVVEIRKGRFGEKSLDHINQDDDGAGAMASATVHRLSVESEESDDTQDIEPKLPYWDHVPGIGPVIPESQILAVVEYMQYWASKQQGMVGPRNINHLLCPPLDVPPTPEDEVSMY